MPYNLSYANSPYIFVESWLDELPPACDLDKEPVLPPFGYDMSGTSRRSERLRARPASGVEGPADSSEAGQASTVANDLVYRGNPFRSAPSLTSRNGSFQSQRTGDSGPPPLSPTRSESSTATGKTTTTSRRAKSPVKSVADLYLAAKQFEFDNEGEVPDGMEKLLDIKDNMEIIPGIIEQEIQQALGTQSKVRPWMVDKDTPTSRETALRELDELRLILEESQFCENFGASEAAWNDGVTSRVLFEALRAIPSVRHHNITTARLENCLLPVDLSGEQFDSKLVDYSMNLVPSADATLEKSIRHLLGLVPRNRKFINQSTYGPIRFSPAGVHIETKASSASDGRPQLSIWIAAWLDQMRFLQCMAVEPLAEFDAAKSCDGPRGQGCCQLVVRYRGYEVVVGDLSTYQVAEGVGGVDAGVFSDVPGSQHTGSSLEYVIDSREAYFVYYIVIPGGFKVLISHQSDVSHDKRPTCQAPETFTYDWGKLVKTRLLQ